MCAAEIHKDMPLAECQVFTRVYTILAMMDVTKNKGTLWFSFLMV